MYVYQFNINRLTDKTMENKCHIEKIYQGNTTNVMKIIDENNVYGKVNKLSLGELKKEDIKKMPIFEVLISQNFPLEGCLLPLIRRKVMGYLFQTIKLEELKISFQPKEPEELLTRSETSSLLKVNLSTLWNWTKNGRLKSYGIGNRVYYKRHEVMQSIINLKN